jgi:hypothetical protein
MKKITQHCLRLQANVECIWGYSALQPNIHLNFSKHLKNIREFYKAQFNSFLTILSIKPLLRGAVKRTYSLINKENQNQLIMKFKVLFIALFLFGFAFSTQAQSTATPQVSKRQVKQQKRIVKGVANGELTKAELKQSRRQQKNIRRHKQITKADGQVTKRERARLHKHQNKASRNIARKNNNKRSRN